jgi:serine/threonine-protein kinase haspin
LDRDEECVVLKIIPIEGDIIVNGEPQKRYDEVYSELAVALLVSF